MAKSNIARRIILESILATILIYITTIIICIIIKGLFVLFNLSIKPLDFLANFHEKVHPTDIYYSSIKTKTVDTNIVLVNIGELNRSGIAYLVDTIENKKPKAIALDVLFDSQKNDTGGTSLLKEVFKRHKDKIVLGGSYDWDTRKYNNLYLSFDSINSGYIDLRINSLRTVSDYQPFLQFKKKEQVNSFSLEILKLVNPKAYQYVCARGNDIELINYIGNERSFKVFNGNSVLVSNLDSVNQFKDKIVILGFLGSGKFEPLDNLRDMYYTPLNDAIDGHSRPDMYGAIIHANILSMTLNENYINEIKGWVSWVITFIIILLHVIPFVYFFIQRHLFYHIRAKSFQFLSLFIILLVWFYLFETYTFFMDLKYLFLGIFLSVDILYLYEALALIGYKEWGIKSIFIKKH